jgi:hypothetical protein
VSDLKMGDVIDEETLAALEERIPGIRDMVMKQWDGSYKFLGDQEAISSEVN